MKNKLIILLLIAHFFKQIVWLGIIPIWHFPDEEQHFSQEAFWLEKGRRPKGKEMDVSREIDTSSEILGTQRDKMGINEFTYHPEYRIPYSKNQIGVYEEKIQALNTKENRQTMVKREAARYKAAYYLLAGVGYKLFYKSDLFIRVFASRLVSIILSTLNVFIIYLIARKLFKDELSILALTFLVAFQPMFSFVSAGVNSDNLFNLVFSAVLYSCLNIFFQDKTQPDKTRSKTRSLIEDRVFTALFLILSLLIGFFTKQQIFIALPIIFFGFILSLFLKSKKDKKIQLLIFSLIMAALFVLSKSRISIPEFSPGQPSKLKETFFQYIFWHLRHTIAETIPWYWGVFNWLGVTLPRWFNRIQSRILIVSALGFVVFIIRQIREKNILKVNNLKVLFLFGAAFIYYFSIISWDYFFRSSFGFSFGIQGRYFFPTIVSHMLLILIGLTSIFSGKIRPLIVKLLVVWWTFYSLVGLHRATTAYYQLRPVDVFLNQVSQYKPVVFKAVGLGFFMAAFFISLFAFAIKFISLNERKNK